MDWSSPSLRRRPSAAFLVIVGLLWAALLRAQFPLELTNAIVTIPSDSIHSLAWEVPRNSPICVHPMFLRLKPR